MLEDLVNSFGLEEEIPEKGIEILRKYNLISLTDMEEFRRSFFRAVNLSHSCFTEENIHEEIKSTAYNTFTRSLLKYPDLREALKKQKAKWGI